MRSNQLSYPAIASKAATKVLLFFDIRKLFVHFLQKSRTFVVFYPT